MDGIPFRELSNSVLKQIESVEVLRGPQGSLYGANSESGLIIVNTKTPSEEFSGEVRLTGAHYSSGETFEGSGFITGAIVPDTLSGSIAFSKVREDAYVKNLGASTDDEAYIDETFLQGRLRWTPSDRLTVNATAYWRDLNAPGIFDQQYVPLDIDHYNNFYADQFNGGRKIAEWTALEDAPKKTTEEEFVAGVSATYALDYGVIDVAASYRSLDEDAQGLDFDLTASPIVAGQEIEAEKYKHIEVRFSSPEGDRFDYILGAAYYEESEERTLATFVGPGTAASYNAAPAQRQEGEDISVFGSANLYVTPKLKFGAGLRYESAKRHTLQRPGELDLGFGSTVSYQQADRSKTFDILLPRVSVLYKVTEDFSLNASVARGYIPGGFNLSAIQNGVLDEDIISYDSETLWSREIGFKWRSADRKLRASGALFYITSNNWQEIQIALDDQGRPVSSDYIGSNASIRSLGAEFEMHWQPTQALSVDTHIGYVDAEYRELVLDSDTDLRGKRVQFVPEYDAGIALRYEWASGFFVRGEADWTGKTPLRARGDAVQKAVTTFGVQVGYAGNGYSIRLYGENLTNERRAGGLAIDNLAFGADGTHYAPLDAPRIIGVELEANW
ncbi:MAG: TonB-dependent receptor [Kordiimonas sp.]